MLYKAMIRKRNIIVFLVGIGIVCIGIIAIALGYGVVFGNNIQRLILVSLTVLLFLSAVKLWNNTGYQKTILFLRKYHIKLCELHIEYYNQLITEDQQKCQKLLEDYKISIEENKRNTMRDWCTGRDEMIKKAREMIAEDTQENHKIINDLKKQNADIMVQIYVREQGKLYVEELEEMIIDKICTTKGILNDFNKLLDERYEVYKLERDMSCEEYELTVREEIIVNENKIKQLTSEIQNEWFVYINSFILFILIQNME